MNEENSKVMLAVVGNLFATGAGTIMSHTHAVMSVAVSIGQLAVSVATVWYIVLKIRRNKL